MRVGSYPRGRARPQATVRAEAANEADHRTQREHAHCRREPRGRCRGEVRGQYRPD